MCWQHTHRGRPSPTDSHRIEGQSPGRPGKTECQQKVDRRRGIEANVNNKYVHSSSTRRNDEDHAAAPLGSCALQTPTPITQYVRWKAREGTGGLGSSGVGIARCRCRACCSDTRFAGKPCEFQVPSVGAAEGLTPNQRVGAGPGASTCATLPQRRHTGCPKRGHWETKLRERQPIYREDRQCTVSRPETRMG